MYGTNGGDGPDVFMKLDKPKDAIIAAKLDLANFPFNPLLFFNTSAVLGKCLASTLQIDESKEVFQTAIEHAGRLQMRFWEAVVVRESGSSVKGN